MYSKIKQISIMFTAILAIITFPLSAAASGVSNVDVSGSITVGCQANIYGDNQGKVGEYAKDTDISPYLELSVKGNIYDLYFDYDGTYLDLDGMNGGLGLGLPALGEEELSLDYKRIILGEFGYIGFQHQLDHDPLTNLEASFGGPKVTHEDFDIGGKYMINYTRTHNDVTINLPFMEGAKLKMGYSEQNRNGYRQSLALNKCGSCHVTSRKGKVDESTKDFTLGIEKKIGKRFTLLYEYLHRDFSENASVLTNFYDDARHPGPASKGFDLPFFDSRIQYDNADLTYGLVPDSQKDSHTLRLLAKLPGKNTLFTSYTHSDILNSHNDRGASTDSLIARFNNRWVTGLDMNLKLRYMTVDNDDIFVDVNEPSSVMKKNKDYPWHDHNPGIPYNSFDPDFTSKSAMSRDVLSLGFDARYSFTPKTFIKFGYEWETIDRGNYVVNNDDKKDALEALNGGYYVLNDLFDYDIGEVIKDVIDSMDSRGDTKTTTDTVNLLVSARPFKTLKTRVGYTYKHIDNPFANVNGVYEDINVPKPSAANPWVTVQYWERQALRSATVSNQPTDVHEVLADVTWSIMDNLSLNVNYKWITEENNQTDYSGWSQDTHMPSLALQYAPMANLNFGLSYIYDWTKTETLVCIPVFDG